MKRFFSTSILGLIVITLIGCAGVQQYGFDRLASRLDRVRNRIELDRKYMYQLRDIRIGKTGFFYILDRNGTIVFHPQAFLIGNSFKQYWFVEKIIQMRRGCLRYSLGKKGHVVFFEPLGESEIICLAILAEEVSGTIDHCLSSADLEQVE